MIKDKASNSSEFPRANTLKSFEFLKANTQAFESELENYLVNGELEYLRGWAFELADREAELYGIARKGIKYNCLHALRRCQAVATMYDGVMDSVEKNKGKELTLEVTLPTYEDIDLLLEKVKNNERN
ncbi:MAG: hypothetical protein WCI72_02640 [archaeon]